MEGNTAPLRLFGPKTHPGALKRQAAELAAQERAERAWQLKLEGQSEARIGKQLGVSAKQVHKYLCRELGRIQQRRQHTAERYVTLQIERLERIIGRWAPAAAGIFTGAEDAWPPAVKAAVKCKAEQIRLKAIQELNRIVGVYAPEQHELSVPRSTGPYVAEWSDGVPALPPPVAAAEAVIDVVPQVGSNGHGSNGAGAEEAE